MTRPIKFRFWLPLTRQMTNTYSLDSLLDGGWFDLDKSYQVMQFTGLHDKNGVEIYEGDIIKWCSYTLGRGPKKEVDRRFKNSVIGWSEKNGAWQFGDDEVWNAAIYSDVEVIGNVYENPDLISNK